MTRIAVVATFSVLLLAAAPAASARGSSSASTDPRDVTELVVHLEVQNANRSSVPCHSDGETYELQARLVGPSDMLAGQVLPAATLYVHGLGLSSYYWRFRAVPGYDHVAAMAELGHVGVVYDRLGYGENPKPLGLESCYGSDADIAAQIVEKLKSGDYRVEDGEAVTFERVTVASHSQAGLIVQPMAYSFDAADALVVTSWTNEGNSSEVLAAAGDTAQACLTGGEQPEEGERPPFYAYFPADAETFQRFYFHNADEEVVAAATQLREPDPCGQGGSLAQTLLVDQARLGEVSIPVLLVYGSHDGYRPQPEAGQGHAELFSGTDDLTVKILDDTGNALTLERTAPQFRTHLGAWLCQRELAHADACPQNAPPPAAPVDGSPLPVGKPPVSEVPAGPLPATGSGLHALGLLSIGAGPLLLRASRRRATDR